MIDTHAHLTDERFAEDVDQVVQRARANGVHRIVTVGTDLEDSRGAVRLAESYEEVFASVGIHPHSAAAASPGALAELRGMAGHARVVAIGETGLDYHYDFSPRDVQRALFAAQLRLGAELDLPVVVHSREADEDLAAMLRELGPATRGVLHSFAGAPTLLETALEIGWYVSFSGMITFAKYHGQEMVRAVPPDRLLVETDSPYLAPVPHRGRRNEPGYVVRVAERAAEIRGEDPDALARATAANARTLFRIPG